MTSYIKAVAIEQVNSKYLTLYVQYIKLTTSEEHLRQFFFTVVRDVLSENSVLAPGSNVWYHILKNLTSLLEQLIPS